MLIYIGIYLFCFVPGLAWIFVYYNLIKTVGYHNVGIESISSTFSKVFIRFWVPAITIYVEVKSSTFSYSPVANKQDQHNGLVAHSSKTCSKDINFCLTGYKLPVSLWAILFFSLSISSLFTARSYSPG